MLSECDFNLAPELPPNGHVEVSVAGELHCYTIKDDL